MAADETRIEAISAWFEERGYDLYVHEIEGHGWRAPFLRKGSLIGAADYGVGDSALAAAEDAQARYLRGHAVEVGTTQSQTVEIGPAIETDTALPITVKTSETTGPEIKLSEIEERARTLTTYGWRVLFEEEPDGKVTGYLLDADTGDTLKTTLGADFEDAWLGLGIDTTPPSEEVRREREKRRPKTQ